MPRPAQKDTDAQRCAKNQSFNSKYTKVVHGSGRECDGFEPGYGHREMGFREWPEYGNSLAVCIHRIEWQVTEPGDGPGCNHIYSDFGMKCGPKK